MRKNLHGRSGNVCRNGKVKKQRRQPVTLLQNETFLFLFFVPRFKIRETLEGRGVDQKNIPCRSAPPIRPPPQKPKLELI